MIQSQDTGSDPVALKEMKRGAKDVLAGLYFLHANRYANNGNVDGFSTLPDMPLTDVLREIGEASRETGARNNVEPHEFNRVCEEFLSVSALVKRHSAMGPLRPILRVEELLALLPTKERALDGLSEGEVMREFKWRLDQLACHLYSLPKTV